MGKRQLLILGVMAIFFISCKQKPLSAEKLAMMGNSQSWQGQMQGLSLTLTELLPYVADSNEFNKPANHELILEKSKKLAQLTHSVQKNSLAGGQDPTVDFILNQFNDDIQRAVESLQSGHRSYAQHLLRNTTSYCIQCHTRTQVGPVFIGNTLDKTLAKLNPLERGEVLAATRQFEQALKEFKSLINSPRNEMPNVFTWDKAVRYALAIAVKFQNDPQEALEIVESILKNKHAPYYLKQSARVWKESIKEWMKEPRKSEQKPSALITKAQALIKKSDSRSESDRAGQIYYLRASSLLHQALDLSKEPAEKAEALYWIGICYETFKDMSFWSLDERYFEACIRINPHSTLAEKCYQKYEENIFMGYTGSSGTTLPPDIQQKLVELKVFSRKGLK
jgi:tetratricopeptide (TPR) repeat protein